MHYNVSSLLKQAPGNVRTYPIDAGEVVPLDDELSLAVQNGDVRFSRTNRGLVARGTVTGQVKGLTCSRCLDPMAMALTVSFEEEYLPTIDISRGTALPPPDDEMAFTIDEGHNLDLSESIRQNTLAALPINPICKADCAGLCPQCGVNRNDTPCHCHIEVRNTPFADLVRWMPASGGSD